MAYTNFPNGVTSFGVPVLGSIGGIPFTGRYIFVDPVSGSDSQTGLSPQRALQTLYKAHDIAIDGNNDVIFLIGDGSTTGTARLSLALAQTVDSAATSGTLTWSKNATHLVGVAAPSLFAQRARIAPPTGTYTQTTFGSGNFMVVSGSGCTFSNFSLFHGFSTGGNNQICMTVSGSRNSFINVAIGGIGDAASAASTSARSLKITGGENTFINCAIGLDTVTRSVANASLEFASGTARNNFKDCVFPFMTSNAGVLGIIGTGAACMDRFQLFDNCSFLNAVKSTSTTMTDLVSMTNASPGGYISMTNCQMVGVTGFGDTNAIANMFIDMAAPSNSAGGLAVAPSA